MSGTTGQRIEKWGVVDGGRIAGAVYDRPGSRDGGSIMTSPVVEIRMMDVGCWPGRYPVAFTESGSTYRLGSPSPDFGTDKARAFIESRLADGEGIAAQPLGPGASGSESPIVRTAPTGASQRFEWIERIELFEASFKPL